MNNHEIYVLEAMQRYGGSFIRALAECFYRADDNNFKKLKDTFSDYWEQYEKMLGLNIKVGKTNKIKK